MSNSNATTVVCFLAINKMPEISSISINSVLINSNCPIIVGYIRKSDIEELPKNDRVRYIQLATSEKILIDESDEEYKDFSQDEFYELVRYKWILFQEILKESYSFVIYSDLDVVWTADASHLVTSTFEVRKDLHVLVQSFSSTPSHPRLCMGFFGFRNSQVAIDFIDIAKNKHKQMSTLAPKVGDDDVITELYRELNYPSWLHELPQSTFPVGNMLSLFSGNSRFPGLRSPSPAIFHANFVVGITNKRILMRLFLSSKMKKDLSIHRNLKLGMFLFVKRIIHYRRLIVRRFST